MKKVFPYIIGGLVLVALVVLMLSVKPEKRFDDRLSFRKNDKIPYGSFVAYEQLKYIFPDAVITGNRTSPVDWDSAYFDTAGKKAVLIITPQLMANANEMNSLLVFAQKGNDVFISTRDISVTAQNFLKLRSSALFEALEKSDSVVLTLEKPPFKNTIAKTYPGRKYQSYIYKYDTAVTAVIGRNEDKDPMFIHLVTGKGNIYLHMAPIAFTNYFLLHKNNIEYYNEALSVISGETDNVIWDEFYLYKYAEGNKEKEPDWLSVLFRYESFRWALLTAMIVLVVFVLLEMRRKQRPVPIMESPRNDSLDFVKTIGRLYYDKNDHSNLCKKMSLYFLEYVRNKYKIPTVELNDDFIKALHYKSGYDETALRQIISFIHFAEKAPAVSDSQLATFHKQLAAFYKVS